MADISNAQILDALRTIQDPDRGQDIVCLLYTSPSPRDRG